jgi:dienelactone hydrolase
MVIEQLEYNDDDTVLEAYVAYQETETKKPLVLVAHDWSGRRELACQAAERMAAMGYVGFALDMYGKGVFGSDDDTQGNAALMNPFFSNRLLLRKRITAALIAGRGIPQVDAARVAAMGYCFGGLCALELARSGADVLGVVSIHGILAADAVANQPITAKVLCLHGHDDPMVKPDQVLAFETEMTDAGVDWQLHAYGNTMHAFTNPAANNPAFGTVYSDIAERRSSQTLANFLEEIF